MGVLCGFVFSLVFVGVELGTLNITSYSKVARWGANTNKEEGRSAGQTFFTQRSDARISSGQNFYTNPLPGKGQIVRQDRFNPPPLFTFNEKPVDDTKGTIYLPPDTSSSNSKPPKSLYDSPVSSYIPPPSGIPKDSKPPSDDSFSSYTYTPPKPKPSPPISSYIPAPAGIPKDTKPPSNDDSFPPNSGYTYDPPKMETKPSDMDAYMGPYAPSDDDKSSESPPSDEYVDYPPDGYQDDQSSHNHDDQDDDHHPYHHHHKPSADMMDMNQKPQPMDMDQKPPPMDMLEVDHPPKPMDEPPHYHPRVPEFSKQIPSYLDHDPTGSFPYNVPYHFSDQDHHHVYKEVYHTTTPAPEEKRVNKGHYSYYYLGRKLWYIPLYFSVYFIVYITVLILKSIARHKVNFVHDWSDAAKARSMGSDLDDSEEYVDSSISKFKNRYMAM